MPQPSWKQASSSPAASGKPGRELEDLVRKLAITVVPFGDSEWHAAGSACARYGRGRHAALNLGDCLAYATAAVAGDSLLLVGADFRYTEIPAAI